MGNPCISSHQQTQFFLPQQKYAEGINCLGRQAKRARGFLKDPLACTPLLPKAPLVVLSRKGHTTLRSDKANSTTGPSFIHFSPTKKRAKEPKKQEPPPS
ncbi:MAG: hypothetical protein CL920_04785 [Deltaproteobacteria bacterium]|nr:hypothetical protein [Deltaproteobacteria bacterium]